MFTTKSNNKNTSQEVVSDIQERMAELAALKKAKEEKAQRKKEEKQRKKEEEQQRKKKEELEKDIQERMAELAALKKAKEEEAQRKKEEEQRKKEEEQRRKEKEELEKLTSGLIVIKTDEKGIHCILPQPSHKNANVARETLNFYQIVVMVLNAIFGDLFEKQRYIMCGQ
jgi:flagellar biosynthesis GTPase FlhF